MIASMIKKGLNGLLFCLILVLGATSPALANRKFDGRLRRFDGGLADRISTALRSQIQRNRQNRLTGMSRENNYVIHVGNAADGAHSADDNPPAVQNVFRNGGDAFWQNVDPSGLNNTIVGDSGLLSGTQYYMVIASVFLYGDTAFSSNGNQVNWNQVKADQQLKTTNGSGVSGGDDAGFTTYCNQLFSYVQSQTKTPMGTNDYVINYFLTVFTRSHGQYKVSYRTYITVGPAISGFAKGFPALNGQLNNGIVTSKQDWLNNNINSDAAYISLYKKNNGDLSVVDFSNVLQPADLSALKQLFGGTVATTDEFGVNRHTLKCRLFIVRQNDPNATAQAAIYNAYMPAAGEMSMLLQMGSDGISDPIIEGEKFGDNATQTSFNNLLSTLSVSGSNFWSTLTSSFGTGGSYTVADFCSGIYEMMDWLSKGISYLEIPAYVWNCNAPGYKKIFSQVFQVVMAPVLAIQNALMQPILSQYSPAWGAQLPNAEFACVVGVWNGLVMTIKAIPEGIKLLTAIGTPNKEWNSIKAAVIQSCGGSMCVSGFLSYVWHGIASQHDPTVPCTFGYAIGNDIFMVLSIYFTGGAAVAAIGDNIISKVAITFLETVQKLDVLGMAISKITGLALNVFMDAGGRLVIGFAVHTAGAAVQATQDVFEYIADQSNRVIKMLKAGNTALSDLDWTLARTFQLSDGTTITVLMNPMSNLQGAITKIRAAMKDADGNLIEDAQGNSLITVADDQGNEDVAVLKSSAGMTQAQLEALYDQIKDDAGYDYVPGTPEHKAERWAQYQASDNAGWDFDRWSPTYDNNMTKARNAHAAADNYLSTTAIQECPNCLREQTVEIGGQKRRLDIGDIKQQIGKEVKAYETGVVYATEDIKNEVMLDAQLVQNTWQIEWIFKGCTPSGPLETLLNNANIKITLVN